ncbi:MAG: D-alanyl-D-alanine carboxypeptidase/D-alanyl-D-alanine-endopeptidase [bacterium]
MKLKILFSFLISISLFLGAFAQDLPSNLDKIINSDLLSKSSIVSVKIIDKNTKKPLYQRDSTLLLQPASTMKIPTSAMVLEILGPNYMLKTSLSEADGRLYLKLCGDPTLLKEDLAGLFKNVDLTKYDTLVIDNTFIDNEFYATGWMWDNFASGDNSPYGVFNLDRNLLPIKIIPNKKTGIVQVIAGYPVEIGNELKIGKSNQIKFEQRPWQNPDAIYISGTVCSAFVKTIPVQNPEKYFLHCLNQSMPNFSGKFYYGEVPSSANLLACKETSVLDVLREQNKKSNNVFAETMFKIAAREAFGAQGSLENARKLFDKFYGANNFVIADASGLSHNNLLNSDFLCDVLLKMSDNDCFRSTLSVAGKDGTLKKRLKDVSLQGKTGTISGVSGLCGYIKTKQGHDYIFSILIQNYKGKAHPAKLLEDKIVRELDKF